MHPEAAKHLTKKTGRKKQRRFVVNLNLSLVCPGFRTSDFEFTKGTVE